MKYYLGTITKTQNGYYYYGESTSDDPTGNIPNDYRPYAYEDMTLPTSGETTSSFICTSSDNSGEEYGYTQIDKTTADSYKESWEKIQVLEDNGSYWRVSTSITDISMSNGEVTFLLKKYANTDDAKDETNSTDNQSITVDYDGDLDINNYLSAIATETSLDITTI